MITRLKVSGFKNLVDVDVRLGPFTCLAGRNGVGKSNLFDAIRFLGASAGMTLAEAASRVRGDRGRTANLASLFARNAEGSLRPMAFEVEMLVAKSAIDDLGMPAEATANFLSYKLTLCYREAEAAARRPEGFEITQEELIHIPKREASRNLPFTPRSRKWIDSILHVEHRGAPFLSTETEDGQVFIRVHQEGGSGGRPRIPAGRLPRTVLSASSAADSPTALCARRELESWMCLQLEASALREPDDAGAPAVLSREGARLPSLLHSVLHEARAVSPDEADVAEQSARQAIIDRLRNVIDGVRNVRVECDEKRDLLGLVVEENNGRAFPAFALPDGALRFLALAVLQQQRSHGGVICLEEPENGLHPDRLPALVALLQDLAADLDEPAGPANPLRQVLVATHSPILVRCLPDDAILLASSEDASGLKLRFLPETWRSAEDEPAADRLVTREEFLEQMDGALPEQARTFLKAVIRPSERPKSPEEEEDDAQQMSLGLAAE